MPIAVLAGIPWLAGVLGGVFSSLFTFFAAFITKRFAILAAAITIIVGLTSALFAGFVALVNTLNLVMPPEIANALGHFMPDNAIVCVTCFVSAKMARFAYDWNIKIIQYKLF